MSTHRFNLEELLLQKKLIDSMQLRSAKAKQHQWGGRLPYIIAEMGFADEDVMTRAIADALNVKAIDLALAPKDEEALSKLDDDYCEDKMIFPVSFAQKTLTVAMADPQDLNLVDEVRVRAAVPRVDIVIASESQIRGAIALHYKGLDPTLTPARPLVRPKFADTELVTNDAPRASPPVARHAHADHASNFTLVESERVRALAQNQKRISATVAALRELLHEKGFEDDF